jgi:hypothetical protein
MVLRSDALLSELVGRHIGAGRVLGLLGTGASILLSTDLVPKSKLPASKYVKTDLLHSGYVILPDVPSIVYKQVFAESEDPENPHPSGLGWLVVGSGDLAADLAHFAKSMSSALRGEGKLPEIVVVIPDPPGKAADTNSGTAVEAIVLPILVLVILIAAGILWFVKHHHRAKPNLQLQHTDELIDVNQPPEYTPLR